MDSYANSYNKFTEIKKRKIYNPFKFPIPNSRYTLKFKYLNEMISTKMKLLSHHLQIIKGIKTVFDNNLHFHINIYDIKSLFSSMSSWQFVLFASFFSAPAWLSNSSFSLHVDF